MYACIFLAVFVFSFTECFQIQMPKYLHPCSRYDVHISECATRSAKLAFPKVVNGDRKLKIPSMNPLKIDHLEMNRIVGDKVVLRVVGDNMTVYGLKKTKIQKVQVDVHERFFQLDLYTPVLRILGYYDIDGKILRIPVNGLGYGNLTLININYKIRFDYDLERKDQHPNFEFMKVGKTALKYFVGKANLELEGLYNGDNKLEKEVHNFLNKNWRKVGKEVGPNLAEAMGVVAKTIMRNVFGAIPYDWLFPIN